MFLFWDALYSLDIIVISVLTTAPFIYSNPAITFSDFFVQGGLSSSGSCCLMLVLIRTRVITHRKKKSKPGLNFTSARKKFRRKRRASGAGRSDLWHQRKS
jgi:hypothetical protein